MQLNFHPALRDINIGDEVYSREHHLIAQVISVFPSAVCVRVGQLRRRHGSLEIVHEPQLWRADEVDRALWCETCGQRMVVAENTALVCPTCRTANTAASPGSEPISGSAPCQ